MKLFLALVSMFSLTLVTPRDGHVSLEGELEAGQEICDNGQYMTEKDLGEEGNWLCQDEKIVIATYYEPAGVTECNDNVLSSTVQCMDIDIHYDDTPPTSGDYRPLTPKYGEYKYLPPQRWLHALQQGAVAFLYHPCAPLDQVMVLKELAQSCLWRHVITPYPHLTHERPLALVSWGCVYRMSWVSFHEAKEWIKDHALQTPESVIDQNGFYDEGLLQDAEVVSGPHDNNICPDEASIHSDTTASTGTHPSHPDTHTHPTHTDTDTHLSHTDADTHPTHPTHPDTDTHPSHPDTDIHPTHTDPEATGNAYGSGDGQQQQQPTPLGDTESCETNCTSQLVVVHVVVNHHPTLVALIVLTAIVLLLASLITAWKIYRAWCKKDKRRKARYKSVSKFFPFSYEEDNGNGVAIPEFGLPKALPAEREMLLNDSDEDEL